MRCERCSAEGPLTPKGNACNAVRLCFNCFVADSRHEKPGAAARSQWCSRCCASGHSAWACPHPPNEKVMRAFESRDWWHDLQAQVELQAFKNRMAGRYGPI